MVKLSDLNMYIYLNGIIYISMEKDKKLKKVSRLMLANSIEIVVVGLILGVAAVVLGFILHHEMHKEDQNIGIVFVFIIFIALIIIMGIIAAVFLAIGIPSLILSIKLKIAANISAEMFLSKRKTIIANTVLEFFVGIALVIAGIVVIFTVVLKDGGFDKTALIYSLIGIALGIEMIITESVLRKNLKAIQKDYEMEKHQEFSQALE